VLGVLEAGETEEVAMFAGEAIGVVIAKETE
jgi:hypothetical protein